MKTYGVYWLNYYPMAEDVYHFDGIPAPTGDSIDNAAKSLSRLRV
ncbi:MAG: hypothetical protein ACYTX0_40240 [Nostoc sp.]